MLVIMPMVLAMPLMLLLNTFDVVANIIVDDENAEIRMPNVARNLVCTRCDVTFIVSAVARVAYACDDVMTCTSL